MCCTIGFETLNLLSIPLCRGRLPFLFLFLFFLPPSFQRLSPAETVTREPTKAIAALPKMEDYRSINPLRKPARSRETDALISRPTLLGSVQCHCPDTLRFLTKNPVMPAKAAQSEKQTDPCPSETWQCSLNASRWCSRETLYFRYRRLHQVRRCSVAAASY